MSANTDNLRDLVQQLADLHQHILNELAELDSATGNQLAIEVDDIDVSMEGAIDVLEDLAGRYDAIIETEYPEEDHDE